MSHIQPLALFFVAALTSQALAEDDTVRGKAIVEANCGGCHAVVPEGPSPLSAAPPFRTLGERYPIEDLEEALAEGILTGHPEMPELSFEPAEVVAVIAYIQSLQPKK